MGGNFLHIFRKERHCGWGFVEQPGDLPHFGYHMDGNLDMSTTIECAKKCDDTEDCESYEFSFTQLKCNLNKALEPTLPVFQDFVFCSKKALHPMYMTFGTCITMLIFGGMTIVPPWV